MVKLGSVVRDKVTGFNGIVVGSAEYINRNPIHLVEPKKNDDGCLDSSVWINESRLEIIKNRKS